MEISRRGTMPRTVIGITLLIDARQPSDPIGPYEYGMFIEPIGGLIAQQRSDVDLTPLRLVADAFMRCRQASAPAFEN